MVKTWNGKNEEVYDLHESKDCISFTVRNVFKQLHPLENVEHKLQTRSSSTSTLKMHFLYQLNKTASDRSSTQLKIGAMFDDLVYIRNPIVCLLSLYSSIVYTTGLT
jgi:hypothetical protein